MNRVIKLTIIGTVSLFLTQFASSAEQWCHPAVPLTTPIEDFEFTDGGAAVTHLKTGLTWKRCMDGMSFDDRGTKSYYLDDLCTGLTIGYTWLQALDLANINLQWRLPNIKELDSIAELGCAKPAINMEVFPYAPGFTVWSATPLRDDGVYTYQFDSGVTTSGFRDKAGAKARVWFVRDDP